MTVTKESETKEGFCQCGRPLHYSRKSLEGLVDRFAAWADDPFVTVTIEDAKKKTCTSYRVQRHYIALHGINARILEERGFERVPDPKRSSDVGS